MDVWWPRLLKGEGHQWIRHNMVKLCVIMFEHCCEESMHGWGGMWLQAQTEMTPQPHTADTMMLRMLREEPKNSHHCWI